MINYKGENLYHHRDSLWIAEDLIPALRCEVSSMRANWKDADQKLRSYYSNEEKHFKNLAKENNKLRRRLRKLEELCQVEWMEIEL